MYTVTDYYRDVFKFNVLADNLNNVTKDKLIAQAKVLLEECNELIDNINADNKEGILDGAVDVTYVVFGVCAMLTHIGYDVPRAMKKTAENNLTKFPSSLAVVKETQKQYMNLGTPLYEKYNESFNVYSLKDDAGKIRKPVGYVKNDLSDCIPE